MMVVCGLKLLKFEPAEAAAFCGLVLVFGSKLVSCDAAGLPFGMVSEPRRRLEPTLAGGLVEYLAVKMYFRVSGRVSRAVPASLETATPLARHSIGAFVTQRKKHLCAIIECKFVK